MTWITGKDSDGRRIAIETTGVVVKCSTEEPGETRMVVYTAAHGRGYIVHDARITENWAAADVWVMRGEEC